MTEKKTVKELRAELENRGLDGTGLKADLVARLSAAIEEEAKKDAGTKSTSARSGRKRKTADAAADEPVVSKAKLTNVEKLTVAELKAALAERQLATTGTKKILLERLNEALGAKGAEEGNADGGKGADKEEGKAPGEEGGEEEEEEEEEEKQVVATMKGRAVLDKHLPPDVQAGWHVLEEGDTVYDAMLNQTDTNNNNNKFYVIQLLAADDRALYQVFTRWGRVGVAGATALSPHGSKESAKREFERKFQDKTKNSWQERHAFQAVKGKYTWLQMDYEVAEDQEGPGEGAAKPEAVASQLDPRVLELVATICDVSMMQQQMTEIGYDARKMPLGKLSRATILQGYEVLKRIAAVLEGEGQGDLAELSSEFFTVIPHDFGFRKMREFIIRDKPTLKKKLEMVESLAEIQLASRVLSGPAPDPNAAPVHPADEHYARLHCQLEPLEDQSPEVLMARQYVENTHASTHSYYRLEVQQVFRVRREGEDKHFRQLPNRQLLWHGSRLSNWAGILSQGLRIAPPEAPVTGYMFGKGVYFADMVSKSANYCYATPPGIGLLLLCEVALGSMRELTDADYDASNLPPGTHSTKGVGATAPDPAATLTTEDGVAVPLGKPRSPGKKGQSSLLYNEYIVYDTSQIRMRYLLKCRFSYPS